MLPFPGNSLPAPAKRIRFFLVGAMDLRGCSSGTVFIWLTPCGSAGTSSFGMSGVNAHMLLNAPHGQSALSTTPLAWASSRSWPLPRANQLVQQFHAGQRSVRFAANVMGAPSLGFIRDHAVSGEARQKRRRWTHTLVHTEATLPIDAGRILVPGMVYMEMAAAAAAMLSERSSSSSRALQFPCLGKVSFVAPMLLSRASSGVDGPNMMLACAVNLAEGTILLHSPAATLKAGPSTYAACETALIANSLSQPAIPTLRILHILGRPAPQLACSCARVAIPPSGASSSFHVHPAMADATLHVGPILQTSESATLIPVAIGAYSYPVSLRGSEQSWAMSKVRLLLAIQPCRLTGGSTLTFEQLAKLQMDMPTPVDSMMDVCCHAGSQEALAGALRLAGLASKDVRSKASHTAQAPAIKPVLDAPIDQAPASMQYIVEWQSVRPDGATADVSKSLLSMADPSNFQMNMRHIRGCRLQPGYSLLQALQSGHCASPGQVWSLPALAPMVGNAPFPPSWLAGRQAAAGLHAMLRVAASESLLQGHAALLLGLGTPSLLTKHGTDFATSRQFGLCTQSGTLSLPVLLPAGIQQPNTFKRPQLASALITGGLGGLGLLTAQWLCQGGSTHVVLLGRAGRLPTESNIPGSELGPALSMVRCDVAVAEEAGALRRERGTAPFDGVLHAGGILQDGLLVNQTSAKFRAVLAPKVVGGWRSGVVLVVLPTDSPPEISNGIPACRPGQHSHCP